MRSIVRKMYGRRLLQSFFCRLHRVALLGMNHGPSPVPSENGEKWFLRMLVKRYSGGVLFDVGANIGDYSELLVGCQFPSEQIHSFEPSSVSYAQLVANARLAGIHKNNIALGSRSGESTLFSEKAGSGLSSLYKRNLPEKYGHIRNPETITVSTIDEYCHMHNIVHIALLKIDVEGHELEVLRGGRNTLEGGRVDTIQFKIGMASLDAGVRLIDFLRLLEPRYEVFRLLKDGLWPVSRQDWSGHDEVFVMANYIALAKHP